MTASSPGSRGGLDARRIRAFARSDLRVAARDGEQLLLTLGLPVLFLVFFSLVDVLPSGDRDAVDFLTPGIVALAVLSVAFVRQAIGLGFDRSFGAIRRFAITPLGVAEFLAAKVTTTLVLAVVQLVVLGAVGLALGWQPSLSPLIVVTVPLGLLAFSALAVVVSSRVEGLLALAVANSLYVILLLLSGLVIDLGSFPGALASAVKVLPSTALAELLRAQLADGATGPGWAWLCLVAWAVGATTAAVKLFRWE